MVIDYYRQGGWTPYSGNIPPRTYNVTFYGPGFEWFRVTSDTIINMGYRVPIDVTCEPRINPATVGRE